MGSDCWTRINDGYALRQVLHGAGHKICAFLIALGKWSLVQSNIEHGHN